MRTLFLDCNMSAAGDMLTAALIELLQEPAKFIERINQIGIPGVRFCKESVEKYGKTGTSISVLFQKFIFMKLEPWMLLLTLLQYACLCLRYNRMKL